jgi:hypothetical protein
MSLWEKEHKKNFIIIEFITCKFSKRVLNLINDIILYKKFKLKVKAGDNVKYQDTITKIK